MHLELRIVNQLKGIGRPIECSLYFESLESEPK